MVDIIVGAIPPVLNNQNKRENPFRSSSKKKATKEKRKNKQDRRKGTRSGVVVTLSKYPERRKGSDRRKKQN
jgi:hypothetical protein